MTKENNLQLAVNAAVSEYQAARMRSQMAVAGSSDHKRPNSWCEFGFPTTLEFEDFYRLYRRNSIASGAVNKLVGTCWLSMPWIIEGEPQADSRAITKWERELSNGLLKRDHFWRSFREADRRRLIGRYSALLLNVADDKEWHEPVSSGVLVSMIPCWESALKPVSTDQFGEVLEWQYISADKRSVAVHPDRVFLLGDWSEDSVGFLEPSFNNIVSLEKVEGGSGESFLKNAARQLNINFDSDINLNEIASMYGVKIQDLHTRFNDAVRDLNRANDLLLLTQGATTTPLVSNVPDPRPTYDINLQSVSCGLDIPSRILVGNQQGERASKEDNEYFNRRCMSRRGELSVEISELFEQLFRLRLAPPKPTFTVMWDDLTESSPSDKLDNAKTMSEINSTSMAVGEEVFTIEEVRAAAGYEAEAEQ